MCVYVRARPHNPLPFVVRLSGSRFPSSCQCHHCSLPPQGAYPFLLNTHFVELKDGVMQVECLIEKKSKAFAGT